MQQPQRRAAAAALFVKNAPNALKAAGVPVVHIFEQRHRQARRGVLRRWEAVTEYLPWGSGWVLGEVKWHVSTGEMSYGYRNRLTALVDTSSNRTYEGLVMVGKGADGRVSYFGQLSFKGNEYWIGDRNALPSHPGAVSTWELVADLIRKLLPIADESDRE
jgi:hypothetical protein